MLEIAELQRLSMMANSLRPDWNPRSTYTILAKAHAYRAYRDLAVALAWIAADPLTKTPARLAEDGPWWVASMAHSTPTPLAFDAFLTCVVCNRRRGACEMANAKVGRDDKHEFQSTATTKEST